MTRVGAITLVRHGEPALTRKLRLTARGYRDWWATYETSGLKPGQSPPSRLLELARDADVIFTSTRPRSIESAQAVVAGRRFQSDALYVEAPLPPPDWPDFIRLPPRWWGVIARLWWWLFDHHEGQETRREAEARAQAAARALRERAARGEDVLLVAHGFFNLMIGRVLEAAGWRRVLDQGFRYWCARRFEPPPGEAAAIAVETPAPSIEPTRA